MFSTSKVSQYRCGTKVGAESARQRVNEPAREADAAECAERINFAWSEKSGNNTVFWKFSANKSPMTQEAIEVCFYRSPASKIQVRSANAT